MPFQAQEVSEGDGAAAEVSASQSLIPFPPSCSFRASIKCALAEVSAGATLCTPSRSRGAGADPGAARPGRGESNSFVLAANIRFCYQFTQ